MFKIKTLTVKNFMSVGNATQAINFDRSDLTLVLGINIDLGGDDSGARNGTGKTTIINALSYALYGQALTNIKRDNLINKTNSKGMLVTCEFEYNNQSYKIERGRKPNTMKFFVGDEEQEITDEAQGDSRETQAEIERMLGMSHEMFKHIVALNTYTEPFLNLKANDQRAIIEQLLGITLLSEKAEKLKEQLKNTKDSIQQEEFNIKAIQDANERIKEQIEALKRRQFVWGTKHLEDINQLDLALTELKKLDIEQELLLHTALTKYLQQIKDINDIDTAILRCKQDLSREVNDVANLTSDIALLRSHKCNTCGQELHDDKNAELLAVKENKLRDAEVQQGIYKTQLDQLQTARVSLGEIDKKPMTYYSKESDAFEHKGLITSTEAQLAAKHLEQDPYSEQIDEMIKTALADINYNNMNALVRTRDHQDFLLKLLTNKDSFIRKRIIDQNLNYLNSRLSQYLDRIGLPHTVTFLNDLTVEITELGRELDFDNLSRGERNRLILSLSWAFRDVYESFYEPINLLFIDELIDSGMDSSGVENSLGILKKMSREHNKSIWLVSHKDELAGRVNNVMTVTKENGFTSYGTDVDLV